MQEVTTTTVRVSIRESRRADGDPSRGSPTDAHDGHRSGSRASGSNRIGISRTRAAIARWSATATCRAVDHYGPWSGEGPSAAGARSPRQASRRAISPRRFCRLTCGRRRASRSCCPGCISRGSARATSTKRCRPWWAPSARASASTITRLLESWQDEYHAVVEAILEGQAVRLPVGRRRPLQHPPGRRPAVHPRPDGRHGRRQEGADRHRRWLPRERTESGWNCCWT